VNYAGERSELLIKERLLEENDPEVLDEIFNYLETRNSRIDFFYILDFIKVSSRTGYAVRAMRLLYSIHSPRLHYELDKLMVKRSGKIFSVIYLLANSQPTEKDIIWFRKEFQNYNLAEYWLSLPRSRDKNLLKNLVKYLSTMMVIKKPTPASSYWYLSYHRYHESQPDAKISDRIRLSDIEAIPSIRQADFLDLILKYRPSMIKPEEFIFTNSLYVKKWLALKYMRSKKDSALKSKIISQNAGWEQAFESLIRFEKKSFLLWPVSRYYARFSNSEKGFFKQRCKLRTIKLFICLSAFLKMENDEARLFWNSSKYEEKDKMVVANLVTMLNHPSFFTDSLFITYILNHKSERLRKRAVFHFPESYYTRFKPGIVAFWLTEESNSIRMMHLVRVLGKEELLKEYLPLIPEIDHFVAKVKLPPIEKKKEEKDIKEDISDQNKNVEKEKTSESELKEKNFPEKKLEK